METTGVFSGAGLDIETNKLNISILVPLDNRSEYEALKNCELDIHIKKHSRKRSLDANAYFHVLVGKIADSMSPPISKARAKNMLICRYGQPQLLPDGSNMIYKTNAPEEFMWEQETLHAIPVKHEDKATFYKIYRGSSTYDTKEMSILIDGTVEEARILGIDTMTPTEIKAMKERWKL